MMVNLFLKNKSKRKRKDQVMYKAPDISSKSDLPRPKKDKGKRWVKRQGVGPKRKKNVQVCLSPNLIRFLLFVDLELLLEF
jgi:hypothetical protein